MFHYLKKCRSEFFIYSLVSVVYALILAATGFVYARVSESALSGSQQVFLTSSLIAVGFFICDIYFDYLPRYLKFKLSFLSVFDEKVELWCLKSLKQLSLTSF
ncbi:hypothetical protein BKM67_07350 [Streptococcus suis]|uniref:Uncharacterized protein n=2 Tax=Streptococcus suis TaxID=1307 RepID=A0AAD0KWH7_STRSU|nr:hypothetical protein BKM66_06800 [Streptococcus suis]AWX97861.1 hypothetical protein BKM67_07350 [Streptococcus suis]